jgi:hypothetical protein
MRGAALVALLADDAVAGLRPGQLLAAVSGSHPIDSGRFGGPLPAAASKPSK